MMVASIEKEFVSNFHSLDGITVGERQKNLFLFLNKTQQLLESTSGKINFSSLKPKTPLEENFKVETLIYFRRVPELLEILKSENPILIDKILNNCPWFIEEAFEKISGEELVTQIFPYLSYNAKLKLINKLSSHLRDAPQADEYFKAIKKTYGVYLASKLLAACSAELIMECIQSNRTEVTPRQLLIIVKKYPKLIEDVFEALDQHNAKIGVSEKYLYVFDYLARYDFSKFLILQAKYNPSTTLGNRATNRFFSREKQSFVQNPRRFYGFLKKTRIGKNLKDDFSLVYFKLFPKSLNQLKENLNSHWYLLKHLPAKEQKLKMLLTTFKAIHGTELWDHPVFVTPELIKMMSPEDREIWMQTHSRPNEITEGEWISYMKTEKSIPLFKKKISFTSNFEERAKLVKCLVLTCKINDDKTALLDVCKYMLSKHRNDHFTVKEEYLKELSDSFDLLELGDVHWNTIYEFITRCRLHGDEFQVYTRIFEKYLFYLLKTNLPIEEPFREWTKLKYLSYSMYRAEPQYEKRCLLMFNKTLVSKCEHTYYTCRHIYYLIALIDWNKRHPQDKICPFINNDCIDCLKKSLAKLDYVYQEEHVAMECVRVDLEKSIETKLLEVYLKSAAHETIPTTIHWLLTKRPLVFLDFLQLITENFFKQNKNLSFNIALSKSYSHLGIPQKISEICSNIMHDAEEKLKRRKYAALGLSYTMNANEFLKLNASYYPPDLTGDFKDEKRQNTYALQQAIPPCLKNINPPSLAFDSIMRFCMENYFNTIQESFYSVSFNAPENTLGPFFNILCERAVSVRKRAIFLASKVLNKSDTHNILEKLMETERNPSAKKGLFKGIFNYFIRNPDDYSWELVKQSEKTLDPNDKETFNILTKCEIPPPYFVSYVLFTWNVLQKFREPDEVILEGKCSVLAAVTAKNVAELPRDFCEGIIREYFLKSNNLSNLQAKVHSFVCKYIIYCASESEQAARMKSTFALLTDYIHTAWKVLDTIRESHQTVSNFVQEFCSDFINKTCHNTKVLSDFITLWDSLLKPQEALDEFLYLRFTSIYLSCIRNKLTILQVGEELALLCDILHDQGSFNAEVFSKSLDFFKQKFFTINYLDDVDENECCLIESVVKNGRTSSCLILAIALLPKKNDLTPSLTEFRYDTVIRSIMKNPNPVVKMRLHHYLVNKVYYIQH